MAHACDAIIPLLTMNVEQLKNWMLNFYAAHDTMFLGWWYNDIAPQFEGKIIPIAHVESFRRWVIDSWIQQHLEPLPKLENNTMNVDWIDAISQINIEHHLPALKSVVICPKCNATESIDQMVRDTRSADEGATVHFTCQTCKHVWSMR